jgi:flagellar protein FliO/FliZ
MSPMAAYMVETFVTLVAVLAVAVVILYGARRLGLGRPHGPMQLIGRLPLDARRSVFLVRVADQVLVLGVSEAGVTRLGEIDAKSIPATPEPAARSFGEILAALKGRKRAEPDAPSSEEPSDA